MIISISGTPGTGKTKVAKILARKLKANLITVPYLIRKKHLRYGYDRKRKTKIINEKDFERAVKKDLTKGANIVESHLAHLVKAGFVFILRTNPLVLEKRLKKRKWQKEKIRENIEAEMLDEITIEALKKNKKVYEIDTSKISDAKTVGIIIKILNNYHYGKRYLPGKIRWLERYGKKFLTKDRNLT